MQSAQDTSALDARVAIFGGSFDPPHSGHLGILEAVQREFLFDSVEITPCGRHALSKQFTASDQDRLAMLELLIKGRDYLTLNRFEIESASVSYSYTSCEDLRRRAGRHAGCFLILGSDILNQLHHWYRWDELLEITNLVFLQRPFDHELSGRIASVDEAEAALQRNNQDGRLLASLLSNAANDVKRRLLGAELPWPDSEGHLDLPKSGAVFCKNVGLWPISSTGVRQQIANFWHARSLDAPDSKTSELEREIVQSLDADVWSYIKQRKLYATAV